MKVKEIRALKDEELAKKLAESGDELFDLRTRAAIKKLVNHREIVRVKKDIAKIKTIMRERELGIK